MNLTLKASLEFLRSLKKAAQIKTSRNFTDFVSDRIVQAGTEATLLAFFERFAGLLDCDIGFIGGSAVQDMLHVIGAPDAQAVLGWLRQYPRVAAMLCALKEDQLFLDGIQVIDVAQGGDAGIAPPTREPDVKLTITCESPLGHGSDQKAGNATIFRRMQILSSTGHVLELPFYAGNAIRGQMRDLLAEHFLTSLGLTPSRSNPPVKLWFFHALYAGGALEENGPQSKSLDKKLGGAGAVRAEGIHELRDMMPSLSALGCALGNRILTGRCNVVDARPRCKEWGTGELPAAQLMEWTYLTRREDHESHEDGDHHGMIANSECLRAGTILDGGIDISAHATDLIRSCIGRGIELLQARGYLGAENRRGLGRVRIDVERAPAGAAYEDYLRENGGKILDYLKGIAAIEQTAEAKETADASGAADSGSGSLF